MPQKLLKFLFIFPILLSLFACRPLSPTDPDFNASVLYDIFPALADSIFRDNRFFYFISHPPIPYPPFPPEVHSPLLELPFFDSFFIQGKNKEILGTFYSASLWNHLVYKRIRDSLENDNTTLVMFIPDTTILLKNSDKNMINKKFESENLIPDSTLNGKNYWIDIHQLRASKKYECEYIPSDFDIRDLLPEYDFVLNGLIEISSIYFDTTYTTGYFMVTEVTIPSGNYKPEPMGGSVYLIKIIKREKFWQIESIELKSFGHF